MPKVKRICKECGRSYEACRTAIPGAFNWHDVACSRECAMKYFARIEEGRKKEREERSLAQWMDEAASKNADAMGEQQNPM